MCDCLACKYRNELENYRDTVKLYLLFLDKNGKSMLQKTR